MIKNIFSVPIYISFVDKIIADEIEKLIVPRLDNLEEMAGVKTDYYGKRIIKPNEVKKLFNNINNEVIKFVSKNGIKISKNLQYWIQDYSYKESHGQHKHGSTLLSGVYYIRAKNNPGNIRFHNPNPYPELYDYTIPRSKILNYDVEPQKGMFILFPNWLSHETIPSEDKNCVRTCLAFNYIT
tara:strand:- start:781 stop:1329 length:549 start_codon:yes stop_codon:yes gene_type:complete